MENSKRCRACSGSGRMMGGGMIFRDCDSCEGLGKIVMVDVRDILKKDSHEYKSAIENIKKVDPTISQEEAENIFDTELNKSYLAESAIVKKPRRGRPKGVVNKE